MWVDNQPSGALWIFITIVISRAGPIPFSVEVMSAPIRSRFLGALEVTT